MRRLIFFSFLFASGLPSAAAQAPVLKAQFTTAPIVVDGVEEAAWGQAAPAKIGICMNAGLSEPRSDCQVAGTVRALWDGPLLYLLFVVSDPDITTDATADKNRSGVQIFIDQYNDKTPKFEEDDGTITISAAGQQTGNMTNADLRYYPTVWQTHLQAYAAKYRYDEAGKKIGYTVEVAWNIGDLPLRNDTALGMEFAIHAASSATRTNQYHLFWNSPKNRGVDDNTTWGTVVLSGRDPSAPMQLNTFMLRTNIRKATAASNSADGLVRGIWVSETELDSAMREANEALKLSSQTQSQARIDAANAALDKALRALRRIGKYPDPYDLKATASLPDPFRFFDGSRVKTIYDWVRRRQEIKELAEYYEFGSMPAAPESLKAASSETTENGVRYKAITASIKDHGNSASFTAALYLPNVGEPPYPVIVEEDFAASPRFAGPKQEFLKGGYAVLSIPTWDSAALGVHGVASDDGNHTGAFFELYPYHLDRAGNDRGVLLAWAWGASRGVDALHYLAEHDAAYADLLDLDRLVVTGFSRWGKAALVAGLFDDRFGVTAPGGSGSGGAAPYRYRPFGNAHTSGAPFGNVYPWGTAPGAEVLGDHVRHQTHNSNEMLRRFLNDTVPAAVEPRMYKTDSCGYGDRLPYDHHELLAAIAPRAVLIDNTNDDYADNAEGDAIGYEGAKPVYEFLGAGDRLGLDIYMGGGGHSLKPSQAGNIVQFANMVLYGKPLAAVVRAHFSTDPYLKAGTYDTYYGGLATMMPWLSGVPK
jgi:endo-1,4-beta-xylanase